MGDQIRLIREALDRHAGTEGATLPILHDIQDGLGYIPREAIPMIAAALNRSRAEIYGVVTFYQDFRSAPAGRHVVRLCQSEACQSRGSAAITAALCERLGIAMGDTSPDGRVTLEPVYCLGLCACGPAAMVDGEVIARIGPATVEAIGAAVAR